MNLRALLKIMRDTENASRFLRKSANCTNATPVYVGSNNVVILAADKVLRAMSCKTGKLVYQISVHGDTISSIFIRDGKLVSCGLDGKIIVHDVESGKMLSKYELHKPIHRLMFNKTQYIAMLERGPSAQIHIMGNGFENSESLFPNIDVKKSFDLNDKFVAAISSTSLFLHWLKFNEFCRHDLPVDGNEAVSAYKQLTCVACHPKEPVVATGNALGEVMIWWNFTTASSSAQGESIISDDDSDSDETELDAHHFAALKLKSANSIDTNWRLLHPKRVKRSVMHWHSSAVTALSFTPEGKQLYSGGLEGVLVKWDLTDSFGEVKNRRFLSMLNSPILAISSPGGLADSHVVVTLERNSVFIINGAMEIIYKYDGLDQIPLRWRNFLLPTNTSIRSKITALPITIEDAGGKSEDRTPAVLMNGALGGLQLVDCRSGAVVDKIDVNQHHYVMYDGFPAPVVSEPLLADIWTTGNFETSPFLATYSELQIPRLQNGKHPLVVDFSTDCQAQIIWWRWIRDPLKNIARFQPVYGESIAYLNCPATDLRFVEYRDGLYAVLLLCDQRILFWQYNPKSENQPTQRPWYLTSCVSSCPELLQLPTAIQQQPTTAATTVYRILPVAFPETADEASPPRKREEALRTAAPAVILLCALGTTIKSFNWIQWKSGNTLIDEVLPLHNLDLTATKAWKSSSLASASAVGGFPYVSEIAQIGNCDDKNDVHLILTIATPRCSVALKQKQKKSREKQVKMSEVSPSKEGGVVVLSMSRYGQLALVTSNFDVSPTRAFAVDASRNFVAVGMVDGTCQIFNRQLSVVSTLAQLPSFPFCDRQQFQRTHRQKTNLVSTQVEALTFLPPPSPASRRPPSQVAPPLAAVVTTKWGRETGRRDLATFGGAHTKPLHETFAETPTLAIAQKSAPGGILTLVDRVSTHHEDAPSPDGLQNELLLPVHRKRRLETDAEVEKTLRQISQYPVDSAPPPEQLLAQIFKKPHHL